MSSSDEPPPLVDSSSDPQPSSLAESSTSDSTSASSESHSSLPELFPIAEFPRPPPTEEFLAAFHTAVCTLLQAQYVEEELQHVINVRGYTARLLARAMLQVDPPDHETQGS